MGGPHFLTNYFDIDYHIVQLHRKIGLKFLKISIISLVSYEQEGSNHSIVDKTENFAFYLQFYPRCIFCWFYHFIHTFQTTKSKVDKTVIQKKVDKTGPPHFATNFKWVNELFDEKQTGFSGPFPVGTNVRCRLYL